MLTSNTNSQSDLMALLLLSVAGTISATALLYYVLLQIEKNTAAQFIHHYATDAKNLELEIEFDNPAAAVGNQSINKGITNDLDPSMENAYASIGGGGGGGSSTKSPRNKGDNTTGTSTDDSTSTTTQPSRLRISATRRVILGILTIMLVLLNYLLLVLSKAPTFLSVTGLTMVSIVALHAQILEEIRRNRYDRLAFVVTLLLLLAAALNLAAYAHKQVAVEDMYQGPARIVGYDTSKYDQLQGGVETTSTRTDLQVAWGAMWACPLLPSKECRAVVNGALCERDGSSLVGDDDNVNDKEQESEEVYYDASGEKITDFSDQTVVYDKDGNVVENHNIDQTTTENQNGQVTAYDENSSDIVNGSNGSESQAYEQTATYDSETGKIQDGSYTYEDTTYNSNGTLKENYVEEETTSEKDDGGQEDYAEEYDVTYKDNGQIDSEEVVVEETEMDANGHDTSEAYDEYYVKENKDGTGYDEAYVAAGEVEYDENGNVKEETYDAEEAKRNSDGTIDEEDVDENINVNQDGTESYNITEEDIVYDEDGNVIQDSEDEWDSGGNRRLRRYLKGDADDSSSSLEQELQDEENENEELKEKNEELEKENEELQEELDELKEEEEEVVEEEESNTESSSTDDDWYSDSYWGETDWSSVWGDYQCYEMFDADLEGISYDASTPPGQDDWPYLNIYGNCRTCEAYIVDYYSTEHFLSIRSYKLASRNYGIAASFGLLLTVALVLKQHFAPKGDNEVDLLASASSGVFA